MALKNMLTREIKFTRKTEKSAFREIFVARYIPILQYLACQKHLGEFYSACSSCTGVPPHQNGLVQHNMYKRSPNSQVVYHQMVCGSYPSCHKHLGEYHSACTVASPGSGESQWPHPRPLRYWGQPHANRIKYCTRHALANISAWLQYLTEWLRTASGNTLDHSFIEASHMQIVSSSALGMPLLISQSLQAPVLLGYSGNTLAHSDIDATLMQIV